MSNYGGQGQAGHNYDTRNRSGFRGGRGFGKGKKQQNWPRQVAPTLQHGGLTDYGWHTEFPDVQRHQALEAAIQAEGFDLIRSRLQLLTNLSNQTLTDQIVAQDLVWMDQNRNRLE